MKNRPKLKNAPKAIFRARDSFSSLQLIALTLDPCNNFMSKKFGIYIHSDQRWAVSYLSILKIVSRY